MSSEFITIKINNWNKHQTRKDLQSMQWFKIRSDIAFDQKLYGLDAQHKWFFIFLLSVSAQKVSDTLSLDIDWATHVSGVSKKDIFLAIDFLEEKQIVTRIRDDDVTRTLRGRTEIVHKRREEKRREEERGEEKKQKDASLPPLAIVWNQNRGILPEIKACNSTRLNLAKARWREKPDEVYWADVIKKISSSEFCTGKNQRGWIATFDFLIRPDTQNKVLEGLYDKKSAKDSNWEYIFSNGASK